MTAAPGANGDSSRPVWNVVVTTVDGITTTHRYSLMRLHSHEVMSLMGEVVTKIRNTLDGGRSFLALENPEVIYNVDHIVRMRIDVPDDADIQAYVHTILN